MCRGQHLVQVRDLRPDDGGRVRFGGHRETFDQHLQDLLAVRLFRGGQSLEVQNILVLPQNTGLEILFRHEVVLDEEPRCALSIRTVLRHAFPDLFKDGGVIF